jgi:hypothetical protein
MSDLISAIEACDWLFFRSIGEPRDNALRIVIDGTRTSAGRKTSQGFDLCWWSYVAYIVLNESYTSKVASDQFEGRWLRKYQKSKVLDYLAAGTIATNSYPGPLKHWGLICASHIIHVVSTDEPEFQLAAHGA